MRNLVETQISPWFYGRMCKQCARLRVQSPAVTGGGPGARMSTSSSPTAPLKFYLQANKIGIRSAGSPFPGGYQTARAAFSLKTLRTLC